jgi:hypothetical protein
MKKLYSNSFIQSLGLAFKTNHFLKLLFLATFITGITNSAFSQDASLEQSSTNHFLKGYLNQMSVNNNKVVMPYKANSMGTWWTRSNDLPRRVQNHQAVTWNNMVYVSGGLDVTDVVDGVEVRRISPKVYSAVINNGLSNYSELNDLPEGIMNHASLVANGYLYVIGGIDADSVASNRIYHAKLRADGTIRNWELNETALPIALWGHTADLINGYIVITGGSNDINVNAISNVYSVKVEPNGELSTFTTQPALGINRNQHAAAVFNNRIYVAGGFDEVKSITNTVVYADVDLSGNLSAWQSATSLPEPLFGLTATSEQGLLIFSGGYNNNEGFSIQYSYFADATSGAGFTWTQSNLYYEHFAHSQSFIHNGKLYVLGGFNIFNVTMERAYFNDLNISSTVKMTEGNFLGEVFDLGMNRQVNSIEYNGLGLENYNFYYRTATVDGTWSGWLSITDEFVHQINQELRYVQYMFTVSGAATDNTIALDISQLSFIAAQLAGTYGTETWTLANSPYWVTDDVTITGTVEVEAGVVLTFSEGTKMVVDGYLNANGTDSQPVIFTSFSGEDGYWNGLHFSSSSFNKNSTLNHVIIENAGFLGHANLNTFSTNQPTINNGIIRNGTNSALYSNNASSVFNTINFSNNKNYLIRIENGGGPVFNDFTLANNELEKVEVTGGNMTLDGYWTNMLTEYHIKSTLNIRAKLVIEKGLNLFFIENAGLNVLAWSSAEKPSLWAIGSDHPDSLITFTSLNGELGGWNGISFGWGGSNPIESHLNHAVVENAINNISFSSSDGFVNIDNSVIRNASNHGINSSSSSFLLSHSDIHDNQGNGYHSAGSSESIINNSNFYNNGGHGFHGSGNFVLLNSHVYDNTLSGLRIIQGDATYYEPQVENVVIENNGGNGIWVTDCFPDFINVDVLNNANHGFLMNANVWPEYFNLNLEGNATNDFRVQGGYINRAITWEVGQYPFIVIESFYVRSASLTIEKGKTLWFAENTGFSVQAFSSNENPLLSAIGSNHPDSLITFTSLNRDPGGWNGISFSYVGNNPMESYLTHVVVENAVNNLSFSGSYGYVTIDNAVIRNASNNGISTSNSTFMLSNSEIYDNEGNGYNGGGSSESIISNCNFYNNGGHGFLGAGNFVLLNSSVYDNTLSGLRIIQGDATYYEPQIENVVIENNGGNGIWATDCFPDFVNVDVLNNGEHGFLMNANVWPEYFNLNLEGNATNDFRVQGGYINRAITWEVGQYPFIVIESFYVRNASLTIEKGKTLWFAENTGFSVQAFSSNENPLLSAIGSNHPDSLITFTSFNGKSGGWNGISFSYGGNNPVESYLTHVVVENALNNLSFSSSNVFVTIDSTIIRNASNRGIYSSNSAFHIKNSQVVNNHGYGIEITGSTVPTLGDTLDMGNDIFGNNIYDIYNTSNQDVNARYNFFNTSNPEVIAQRIFDQADNASYGTVHVDPNSNASASPQGRFISANIFYDNNAATAMSNVEAMLLNNSSEPLQTAKSTSEGNLTFVGLHDHTYNMELVSEKAWGGVNATDALLVMQHFAEIITLNGIRLKAADVNASGSVNSTDALSILQRFARITDSFVAGDWAFHIEDELAIVGNDINTTIRALAYGDVNGSFVPDGAKTQSQNVSIYKQGEMVVEFAQLDLPIYLQNPDPVSAISLRISYPENYLAINNVEINGSSSGVVYSTKNGVLNIAWSSINPATPAESEALLNIGITVLNVNIFNEGLELELVGQNEIADNNASIIEDAKLIYPEIVITPTSIEQIGITSFEVGISPNPASSHAVLGVNLPEDGLLEYSIFSSTGALVTQKSDVSFTKGKYQEGLNITDLRPGVYLVRTTFIGSSMQRYSNAIKFVIL